MKQFEKPILVTRPYLPSLEQYKEGLEEIWSNQWLTNNGPVLQRFHSEISSFLDIPENNMSLFNNGTLALEIIFHAMGLAGGEVITTPFTFVATAHAIKRIGATPVFADIDPETLCLSPAAVERKITSRTKAIVPVHVYGHPCDVEGFQRLSEKYGVPIIYDSAHAFGVKINGKTIAEWGDANMFSFHSTKLFHSIEGGLLTYKDSAIKEQVDNLRNFAIKSDTECVDVGTNAKMNPPLRSKEDRDALVKGIIDGTIDMIATDHAPHSAEEKSKGLEKSAFGVVGIETAFPIMYTYLVKTGIITLERLVELMVINPRKRFEIPLGCDYSIWDLQDEYIVDPAEFISMGKATPFEGWKVNGRCLATVCDGKIVYKK